MIKENTMNPKTKDWIAWLFFMMVMSWVCLVASTLHLFNKHAEAKISTIEIKGAIKSSQWFIFEWSENYSWS